MWFENMEKEEAVETIKKWAKKYDGEVFFDEKHGKWQRVVMRNGGFEWRMCAFKDSYGRSMDEVFASDRRQMLLDMDVLYLEDVERLYKVMLEEQDSDWTKTYRVMATSADHAVTKAMQKRYGKYTTWGKQNGHCWQCYDEDYKPVCRVNCYVFCQF